MKIARDGFKTEQTKIFRSDEGLTLETSAL